MEVMELNSGGAVGGDGAVGVDGGELGGAVGG